MARDGAPGLGIEAEAAACSIGKRDNHQPQAYCHFAYWPVAATRWLVLPRPLLFPGDYRGPAHQGRQDSSVVEEVDANCQLLPYLATLSFWLPFPQRGNADRHPCLHPGSTQSQERIASPSMGSCGTAHTGMELSLLLMFSSRAPCPTM